MTTSLKPDDVTFEDHTGPVRTRPLTHQEAIPELSIVLPVCNECENLPELFDRLRKTLEPARLTYELIFIDDGSTDGGVAFLENEARRDERVKVLVLSRNFGQHIAATAGIDAARGEMVLWMDADLQEPPEDIPRFIAKYREGFEVVYARRRRRQQPRWRATVSEVFLKMLDRLVRLDVSSNRACMRLFSSKVAESLRRLEERNRHMAYLMPWVGFRCTEIEIDTGPRNRGKTKYSLPGLMRHALTGLTSFSVAPLRIAALFSAVTILMCLMGAAYVLYRYFAYGFDISGWASLIIAMLMLHSLQFAVLAVIGEYTGLTYTESKRRPLYFCDRMINFPKTVQPARRGPRLHAADLRAAEVVVQV